MDDVFVVVTFGMVVLAAIGIPTLVYYFRPKNK
jgi:hypothetical protein